MDKVIYICPKCKMVYIGDKNSGKLCSNCNVDLIATDISEQDWYSRAYAEREELKQKICDGSISEEEIAQQLSQSDPFVRATSNAQQRERSAASSNSGWNSLLRCVAIINLIVTCIGALIIGLAATDLLGFAGLIIAALLVLFAFVSTGAVMIFLDISSDIRAIRRAVDKNK